MIVCHCHGLTDRDIRAAAARSAARSPDELGPECPAGRSCGGCASAIEEILRASGSGSPAKIAARTERTRSRRSA